MITRLDVIGIGNAMVDTIISTTQHEIKKNNLNRNSMNLINEQLKNKLHENYSIKKMIGGGSLGNSMFGITSFGGNGSFIGKIKDDKVGKYLQQDMVQEGLRFPLGFTSPNVSTGCCTIFVEEDGTRTMCTYLGAGTLIVWAPTDLASSSPCDMSSFPRPWPRYSECIPPSSMRRLIGFSYVRNKYPTVLSWSETSTHFLLPEVIPSFRYSFKEDGLKG